MTLRQTVPTTGVGGMVQWSRAFGGAHYFTAGTDFRWVDGDSEELGLDALTGTQVTLERISGGTQRSVGVFVQDLIAPLPDFTITLSARVDNWRNYDGHNLEHLVPSGTPTVNHNPALPTRSDTVASPRVAALYHVTDRIGVWGDVGWGFRAPTLNELYRQFRVGTTLTLANNALGPERLVGGEAGLTLAPASNVTIRTSWFDNRVEDPVSNVTISTGATITQQRQNLGRTRIWGVQTDARVPAGNFVEILGRVRLRPGEGDGEPRERDPRGQVPSAGADAPGLRAPGVLEPQISHRGGRRSVRRRAVRRRSEHWRHASCRSMRRPISSPRARSAGPSRSSWACRIFSTRSTSSARCRPRWDRQGSSAPASGYA